MRSSRTTCRFPVLSESLAAHLREIRARGIAGRRVVIGIAGSPGGGKTTLAKAIVDSVNEIEPGIAVHLPLDGFHLANSTLTRLGLRDRKGAIETFDGWGFLNLVHRLRDESGHTVFAPSFERTVDEGVAGEIAIDESHRLVIAEGNYLLSEQAPWAEVKALLDDAWFCETDDDERFARLVDRHTRHGRSRDAAEAWAREVDGANAVLINATRVRANLVVSGVTGEIVTPTDTPVG